MLIRKMVDPLDLQFTIETITIITDKIRDENILAAVENYVGGDLLSAIDEVRDLHSCTIQTMQNFAEILDEFNDE